MKTEDVATAVEIVKETAGKHWWNLEDFSAISGLELVGLEDHFRDFQVNNEIFGACGLLAQKFRQSNRAYVLFVSIAASGVPQYGMTTKVERD